MHLLLVEDDVPLARGLKIGLEKADHAVDVAHDGLDGERQALSTTYDAIIVDWMMPRQDGLTMIQHLRAAGIDCPILMLTALSEVEHRVEGLDAGADDYLTKPFSFDELYARLRALRRRDQRRNRPALRHQVGPLAVDERARTASWNQQALDLRAKEYDLLALLLRRANETLARDVIAELVWGDSTMVTDDTLNTTVSGLRKKLRAVGYREAGLRIKTIRGTGYQLVANDLTPQAAS